MAIRSQPIPSSRTSVSSKAPEKVTPKKSGPADSRAGRKVVDRPKEGVQAKAAKPAKNIDSKPEKEKGTRSASATVAPDVFEPLERNKPQPAAEHSQPTVSKLTVTSQALMPADTLRQITNDLDDAYNFALSQKGRPWDGQSVDITLVGPEFQFTDLRTGSPISAVGKTSGPHEFSMKVNEDNSYGLDAGAHEFTRIIQRQIMGPFWTRLPLALEEGEASTVGYSYAHSRGGDEGEYPQYMKTAYLAGMSADEIGANLNAEHQWTLSSPHDGFLDDVVGVLFVDHLGKKYGGNSPTALEKLGLVESQIGEGVPFQSAYSNVFQKRDGTPGSYQSDIFEFTYSVQNTENHPDLRFKNSVLEGSWNKAKTDYFSPLAQEYISMTPEGARERFQVSDRGSEAQRPEEILMEYVGGRENLPTSLFAHKREGVFEDLQTGQSVSQAFEDNFNIPWDETVDDFVDHLEDTESEPESRLEGTHLTLGVSGL